MTLVAMLVASMLWPLYELGLARAAWCWSMRALPGSAGPRPVSLSGRSID